MCFFNSFLCITQYFLFVLRVNYYKICSVQFFFSGYSRYYIYITYHSQWCYHFTSFSDGQKSCASLYPFPSPLIMCLSISSTYIQNQISVINLLQQSNLIKEPQGKKDYHIYPCLLFFRKFQGSFLSHILSVCSILLHQSLRRSAGGNCCLLHLGMFCFPSSSQSCLFSLGMGSGLTLFSSST